ncbi:MAG: hypothetical protein AB7N76_04725 [Planctomycetota bacterium]
MLELPPQALEQVLADAAARRRDPAGPGRALSLVLRSGQRLRGHVLGVAEGVALIELVEPGQRGAATDVSYVPLASIEALTLHDARELAPRPPAPSALELRRRLAALAEAHQERGGAGDFALTGDLADEAARGAVACLLDELGPALAQVAAAADGREALRAGLRGVRIGATGGPSLARWSEGVLHLEAGKEPLERATLVKDIEREI